MYKLSRLAAKDFTAIYTYSLQNFGAAQADAYTEELERTFKLLFSSPLMGVACPEVADEVRRFEHHKHSVFYRRRPTDIFIIRILHQQMDTKGHRLEL